MWDMFLGPGLIAALLVGAPAFGAVASSKSAEWLLSAEGRSACASCPSGFTFSFASTNVVTGASARFSISNMMDHVDSIHLFDSKAVVVGAMGTNGGICTVYDLDAGRQIDEFYGFDFSAAPSGRYVTFLRFHPRHSSDADMSAVLLLYDFARSATENRTPNNRKKLDAWTAGIPVFPIRNRANQQIAPYPDLSYFVHTRIAWSPSGEAFAFVAEAVPYRDMIEKKHEVNEIVAVTVAIPKSIADARVYLKRIPAKALFQAEFRKTHSYMPNIKSISLHDDGHLEFHGEGLKTDASVNPASDHDEQN